MKSTLSFKTTLSFPSLPIVELETDASRWGGYAVAWFGRRGWMRTSLSGKLARVERGSASSFPSTTRGVGRGKDGRREEEEGREGGV
jgi:hypothetical protein